MTNVRKYRQTYHYYQSSLMRIAVFELSETYDGVAGDWPA